MYIETGTNARPVHFRKMFDNMSDALYDINKYKNYANVYHSIYWFRKTEQKYDQFGNKTRIGPDYTTATIKRVVLDIDAFHITKRKSTGQTFEYYSPKAHEDMKKLEEWCAEQNLLRQYRFSGGGFYFIFSAKGHPLKLRDFELNLMNELDVNIDVSTVGDTSRMMRVTNSFNFKDKRQCFCIPLRKEELLDLSFEEIKELAQNPRYNKRFIYGENTYDFSNCKLDEDKIKRKKLKLSLHDLQNLESANDILEVYGWRVDDFCDTIKGIINMEHVGNSLRIELIKYLKDIVKASFEDNAKLMVTLLGDEGMHSIIEGQAKYAYAGDWVFNPHKLKGLGYCPLDCKDCVNYRNIIYKVKRKLK